MTESNEIICSRLKKIYTRQRFDAPKIRARIFNWREEIKEMEKNIQRLGENLKVAETLSRAASLIGTLAGRRRKPAEGAVAQTVQRTAAQIAVERLSADLRQAKANLARMHQNLKVDEKELFQLEANKKTTERDLLKFNC